MSIFTTGGRVRHVKTNTVYSIKGTPDDGYTLEKSGAPAYVYQLSIAPENSPLWIRSQSEMEDGRFVAIS